MQSEIGSCGIENVAVYVLTSIASWLLFSEKLYLNLRVQQQKKIAIYKDRNTILIDAGALSLSKDESRHKKTSFSKYGRIEGHDNLHITSLSQEIGVIKPAEGCEVDWSHYKVGMLFKVFPNHSCLTAYNFEKYHIVEGEKVIDVWKTCPRSWTFWITFINQIWSYLGKMTLFFHFLP